ncbi:hypothetical protein [Acidocella sp.]|jgi:hypothetical protein|uniref:hypothetical protein n=1 Tax=Acidocella sp. TaxID=50710 RepID=UPI002F3FD6E3
MTHAINLVVSAILTLAGLVMELIGVIDGFLVTLMTSVGLPPLLQVLILIGVALWLVVAAFRVLGRVFALLILILVVLLLVHWMMHGGGVHRFNPMQDLHIPGARQI